MQETQAPARGQHFELRLRLSRFGIDDLRRDREGKDLLQRREAAAKGYQGPRLVGRPFMVQQQLLSPEEHPHQQEEDEKP